MKACRRLRRPAILMTKCLANKVLSTQYEFREPNVTQNSLLAGSSLPAEAFMGDPKKLSFEAKGLVSTDARTPWFSPAAAILALPTADNFLVADLEAMGVSNQVGKAWIGQVCDHSHELLVGLRNPSNVVAPTAW